MELNGIHPTALVSKGATIAKNVSVGPYSIIAENVEIGEGTILHSHVVIEGHTKIGKNNQFHPFCSIGGPPQDSGYKNEPTKVEIGDDNIFREYVSIHRGTMKENQITKIGSKNLLMAYVHCGHDVVIGDKCIVANSTNFAGHVKIGSGTIIGGGTNISQFVTLGKGAYIGGASAIDKDIPMYCTAVGNRVRLKGVNIVGMRRLGIEKVVISEVVDFFRLMESSALSPRAFISREELMSGFHKNVVVMEMCEAIKNSEIGVAPFTS